MDVKIKQNLNINSEGSCQNFVDLAVLDMVGDMALMWPAIFGIFFLCGRYEVMVSTMS